MKKGDMVCVSWVDSMKTSGWTSIPEDVITQCTSVGFFVHKKKDCITVALNKSAYGYGDYISIPLCAVKKIRRLK